MSQRSIYSPSRGKPGGLWTRDFTIITLGSAVSMLGARISSFILGILVLDYTGSTMLFAVYEAIYMLPWLICPLLAGPYLDRMSRKKAVYHLDFFSAGLYLTLFVVLGFYFSYPLLLAVSLIIGTADSIYVVAYESLYPNLVPEGCSGKAYSVGSILSSVSMAVTPVAAFLYDWLGSVRPLFLFNALCFLVAACFERTIGYQETHMAETAGNPGLQGTLRRFSSDLREGLAYLAGERGLLFIALYFTLSCMTGSAGGTLYLPFFRNNSALYTAWPVAAVTLYSIVTAFSEGGRVVGGAINYLTRIPARRKFSVALIVYLSIALIDAFILYLPIPLMAAMFFVVGLLGVTSYNIRVTATQAYVPDIKRARFNGIFSVTTSVGTILGQLMAGAASSVIAERTAVTVFSLLELASVILTMIPGRRHVSAVYNVELTGTGRAEL